MSDIVVEPEGRLNIDSLERISSQERVENQVHNHLIKWMGGGFRKDFKDCLDSFWRETRHNEAQITRCVKLATLQKNLARVLALFIEDGVTEKYHGQVAEILFGNPRESVVNCLGQKKAEAVEEQLIGAISVLTFVDLIKKVRPDLGTLLKISGIVPGGREDVEDKIDIILRFGDRFNGKEIIRLIQLKTSDNEVGVERVNPPNFEWLYLNRVSDYEARKLAKKAEKMEELNKNILGRCFIVLVPNFRSGTVNNAFGIIREQKEGVVLINSFGSDASFWELLPKQNINYAKTDK